MKKAIAVCALSMAVQTAFGDARPLVGFEAKSGFLIAAEQKSNSFVAIDAQQAGAPTWAWEWKAARDPGIDKGDVKFFNAPSDCKVSGDALLVVASCGNFAEISLATGRAVCYGHVGGNPHSITRLPGKGMYATASSVSHAVTVICTAENPHKPDLQPKRAFPLTAAHGVEWDAKRNCLWALGHTNLVRYAWNAAQFDLKVERSYDVRPVGGRGGHDLVPDGAGGYFITTGMCLVHFDPDLGEMSGGHAGRETLPNGEFRLVERLKDIKAYSPDATWGNAYTTVRTVWWTDRIIVKKGNEERMIGPYPGAKFYKARWMK